MILKLPCSARGCKGITLIEIMVSMAIFSITLLGFILGLVYVQQQNRALTQRELAATKAMEIVEMIKNLNYMSVRYSTDENPVYLKSQTSGSGDPEWRMPEEGEWRDIAVSEVNSSQETDPGTIVNKLPDGEWTVEIEDLQKGSTPQWDFRKVTVTLRWNLMPGGDRDYNYTLETYIAPGFSWI